MVVVVGVVVVVVEGGGCVVLVVGGGVVVVVVVVDVVVVVVVDVVVVLVVVGAGGADVVELVDVVTATVVVVVVPSSVVGAGWSALPRARRFPGASGPCPLCLPLSETDSEPVSVAACTESCTVLVALTVVGGPSADATDWRTSSNVNTNAMPATATRATRTAQSSPLARDARRCFSSIAAPSLRGRVVRVISAKGRNLLNRRPPFRGLALLSATGATIVFYTPSRTDGPWRSSPCRVLETRGIRREEGVGVIDYDGASASGRTSVLSAVRRFWWAFLVVLAVFVLLGLFSTNSGAEKYRATAELIITDARARQPFTVTDLGAPSNQPSERYLADQVELLRSAAIASDAADLLDGDVDTRTVLEHREITGDLISNLIEVNYEAGTAEEARRGADAIAQAYIDARGTQLEDAAATMMSEYDDLVTAYDQRVEDIQAQIQEIQNSNQDRREVYSQIQSAIARLRTLRDARDGAEVGSDERAAFDTQITELAGELTAWELIARVDPPGNDIQGLLAEQDALITEREAILSQQNSIAADLQIIDVGVEFFSPALLPEAPVGLNAQIVLALFIVMGAALGATAAYGLALRRRDFSDQLQPESILEAPMIGEIPSADEVGADSPTPVATHRESRTAEAFRFVALAISTQQERAKALGEEAATVVGVAAATHDDGAGVVAANVAIAYAEQGRRVLVVDADFEHRVATRVLVSDRVPTIGIGDVQTNGGLPSNAIVKVDSTRRSVIELLGRGMTHDPPAMVFANTNLTRVFSSLGEMYDLVIVACPPTLEVAYSRRVLDLTDATLAVIGHGTSVSSARRFKDQLLAAGAPVVGYVYNRFSPTTTGERHKSDQVGRTRSLERVGGAS